MPRSVSTNITSMDLERTREVQKTWKFFHEFKERRHWTEEAREKRIALFTALAERDV